MEIFLIENDGLIEDLIIEGWRDLLSEIEEKERVLVSILK